MKELRCRICGGNLILISDGVLECESCGTRMIIPPGPRSADTQELLDRAWELMDSGDFDSAYILCENLLAKDPSNTEARWNLLLSRFGIQYVKDALTGRYKPTINRMRYDSILEDPDYRALLEGSSGTAREEYERQAGEIADIQEKALSIVRSEKPYDVFISFKAEDSGIRTRDSVIAQEIYNRLTERGIRTFYSRISLKDKSGSEYEPYIFAALHSARLMLLVTTSRAHTEGVWVKNEWSRFLALMREDRSKSLLPVYEGMRREDFPAEIPVREAVDYAKDGALPEIVQGVLTLTGLGIVVDEEDEKSAVVRLTESLRSSVEAGQWQEAREIADEILDLDPENGDAYFYLLLAAYRVMKPTQLADLDDPWPESRNYQRVMRYADPSRKQLLESVKTRRSLRQSARSEELNAEAERQRLINEAEPFYRHAVYAISNGWYDSAIEELTGRARICPESEEMLALARRAQKAEKQLKEHDFLYKRLKEQYPEIIEEGIRLCRQASGTAITGLLSKKVREEKVKPYKEFLENTLKPLEDRYWEEFVRSLKGSALKKPERPISAFIYLEEEAKARR